MDYVTHFSSKNVNVTIKVLKKITAVDKFYNLRVDNGLKIMVYRKTYFKTMIIILWHQRKKCPSG